MEFRPSGFGGQDIFSTAADVDFCEGIGICSSLQTWNPRMIKRSIRIQLNEVINQVNQSIDQARKPNKYRVIIYDPIHLLVLFLKLIPWFLTSVSSST